MQNNSNITALKGGSGNDTLYTYNDAVIILDGGDDLIQTYNDGSNVIYTILPNNNFNHIIEYNDINHTINLSAFENITFDDIQIESIQGESTTFNSYQIILPNDQIILFERDKRDNTDIEWTPEQFNFNNLAPVALSDQITCTEDTATT